MLRRFTLSASLLLAACGGGGDGTPVVGTPSPTPTPLRSLSQPEVALATRIAEAQLANGAWTFQQKWFEPVDHGHYGYQNVTGITALGLFDAHAVDLADDGVAEDTWFVPATLDRTKAYLIQWCEDFVAGTPNPWGNDFPGMIPTSVSVPTILFLAAYDDAYGLAPAELAARDAAWAHLLALRDASHGSDPAVLSDGLFNRIQAVRTSQGIPGIVGWDNAFILKTLLALGAPQSEIDWQVNALKALPVDAAQTYGLDAIAHTLEALNLAGDTSANAALLAAMNAERNPDGSYTDNPEAAHQTTAYCLLALRAVDSPLAVQTAEYLASRVQVGGHVFDPADNLETFEVTGEILLALLR
jgi:hypothetical protein